MMLGPRHDPTCHMPSDHDVWLNKSIFNSTSNYHGHCISTATGEREGQCEGQAKDDTKDEVPRQTRVRQKQGRGWEMCRVHCLLFTSKLIQPPLSCVTPHQNVCLTLRIT